jgi:hypothetical protein
MNRATGGWQVSRILHLPVARNFFSARLTGRTGLVAAAET